MLFLLPLSREPSCFVTCLKCLYTNACCMGNKQELEICVRSQGYNLIAIAETWWDSSRDRNTAMDGHGLSKKDMSERRSGGLSHYMREKLECIELYPGTDKGNNNLWIRIKGCANMGDTVVGFHCRPPDQERRLMVLSVESWK